MFLALPLGYNCSSPVPAGLPTVEFKSTDLAIGEWEIDYRIVGMLTTTRTNSVQPVLAIKTISIWKKRFLLPQWIKESQTPYFPQEELTNPEDLLLLFMYESSYSCVSNLSNFNVFLAYCWIYYPIVNDTWLKSNATVCMVRINAILHEIKLKQ